MPNGQGSFLFKTDKEGNYYLWHTFSIGEYRGSFFVDSDGNVYMTCGGVTEHWLGPDGELPINDTGSIYVLKLDTDGNYVWHTFLGSKGVESGGGFIVDDENNIYLAGSSMNEWFGPADEMPLHTASSKFPNCFAAKFNEGGNYQWHTFYGPKSSCGNIYFDENSSITISGGSTESWDGPGGIPPLNPHSGGKRDALLVNFVE